MYKLLPKQITPFGEVEAKVIQRLSDNAFIPMDEANTDFIEYQKWLSAGNEPLPAENT
jgi:hypothetical protein